MTDQYLYSVHRYTPYNLPVLLYTLGMATGANTTPLGPLHPILAARLASQGQASQPPPPSSGVGGGGMGPMGGSKAPELWKHLEAAKRAAEALFPCELHKLVHEM